MHVSTRVSRIPRPCGRDCKRCGFALLGVLFLLLVVYSAQAAPEPSRLEEGLIIAVDISLSMRKKLPAVQHAVLGLINGLDVQRQYRVALVRFGTTTNQVIDLPLDGEVARGILRSAVQQLHTTDQWTHFDELMNYVTRKVPTFSTARVSGLVYSDGECSPDPTSGKRCVDPQTLGALVPLSDFNMYLVRITSSPQPPTAARDAQSIQVFESKLAELTAVSRQILQRIQAPPPRPVPDSVSIAAPQRQPTPVPSNSIENMILPLAVLAAVILLGVLWWVWLARRFRPFVLTVSLDDKAYDVPIDVVPTALRIGSTVDCDCVVPDLQAPFSIVVKRKALQVEVPVEYQLFSGERPQIPKSHDGHTAWYDLKTGNVVKLVTPSAKHWLTVDQRVQPTEVMEEDAFRSDSPLDLLGIR